MPTALLSLPIWLLSAIVISAFVAAASAGLLAARRWLLPRLEIGQGDAEFGGAMVQAILVFYALAIALVAVSTWEEHSALSDRTSHEAVTIATLYRQSLLYPDDVRDELQQELVDYTRYIIDVSWPAQARGEVPERRGVADHRHPGDAGLLRADHSRHGGGACPGTGHLARPDRAAPAQAGRGGRPPLRGHVGLHPRGRGHRARLVLPLRGRRHPRAPDPRGPARHDHRDGRDPHRRLRQPVRGGPRRHHRLLPARPRRSTQPPGRPAGRTSELRTACGRVLA